MISTWWAGVDTHGTERHTVYARCGVCGELTEADTCCQQEVC